MSDDLSIRDIRLDKLAKLRELGFDPYATERFDRTDSASGLLKRFAELGGEKEDSTDKATVSFAGRLVSMRIMGKAAFAHLSDGDDKIQGYFKRDEIGESAWEAFNLLDIGDHVGVTGYLFTTKTGEKSIHVKTLTPLSKSLQTLPLGKVREIKDEQGNKIGEETWYELEDVEQRYRHRHLDLVCNTEARQMLLMRSRIVRAVRDFFDSNGYFEVETPILQLEAGGAAARTFNTFYNAYDMDVKLRISLELYLKRIICGDVPKVYEIGRVFRNEGVSNRHNPEFTLLEWYEAYANLEDVMTTVEELFRYVSKAIAPSSFAGDGLGSENEEGVGGGAKPVDWSKPWHRVDLLSAIEKYSGLTADDLSSLEKAKKALGDKEVVNPANGKRIHVGEEANLGGLIEKLLEVFVEPTLQEPTFVVGYPLETSPLAKKDPNRPGFTRRFEGYVFGREICNAFSEINDPRDQRERFEHQVSERSRGDEEAHPMDEDFLYALEGGMPPTGGCGIGIDRLVMLMTGAEHLREILLFPMMKPN